MFTSIGLNAIWNLLDEDIALAKDAKMECYYKKNNKITSGK